MTKPLSAERIGELREWMMSIHRQAAIDCRDEDAVYAADVLALLDAQEERSKQRAALPDAAKGRDLKLRLESAGRTAKALKEGRRHYKNLIGKDAAKGAGE